MCSRFMTPVLFVGLIAAGLGLCNQQEEIRALRTEILIQRFAAEELARTDDDEVKNQKMMREALVGPTMVDPLSAEGINQKLAREALGCSQ